MCFIDASSGNKKKRNKKNNELDIKFKNLEKKQKESTKICFD